MRSPLYWAARLRNGLAKVAAGLTPFGESVWPGVRNDLFVAHASIYEFFASHVDDKRVVDAGCGAGYGSHLLATRGAVAVLGLDVDKRSVRFARRRYQAEGLRYEVTDLERWAPSSGSCDLIVSSNVLEHLDEPDKFLAAARAALSPGGRMILALPPIVSEADRAVHDRIHYHRSNLSVDGWLELFEREDWGVEIIAHRYSGRDHVLDFTSPLRSTADVRAFFFAPSTRDEIYAVPPITVVYVLEPR